MFAFVVSSNFMLASGIIESSLHNSFVDFGFAIDNIYKMIS